MLKKVTISLTILVSGGILCALFFFNSSDRHGDGAPHRLADSEKTIFDSAGEERISGDIVRSGEETREWRAFHEKAAGDSREEGRLPEQGNARQAMRSSPSRDEVSGSENRPAERTAASGKTEYFYRSPTQSVQETPVFSGEDTVVELTLEIPDIHPLTGEAIAIPAVLAFDSHSAAFTPEQQTEVNRIINDFVKEIGDASNPMDPAYIERWKYATSYADYLFKARFGKHAFVRMNLLATQQANANIY